MARILVHPDQLAGMSARFQEASGQLWAMERRLWAVMRSLDWETRQRAGVDEQVSLAGTRVAALAGEAESMSRFLSQKARQFADADRAGADSVGSVQGWYQGALNGAFVAARHTWWQAHLRGDQETLDAIGQQANQLRGLGASTTEDEIARIDQVYAPQAAPVTPRFNGTAPAPSTTLENAARPVTAPVISLPGGRSRTTYDEVINQFAVGSNPRYAQRDSNGDGEIDTFCNIFVWDVTRAMGAEIPHWVGAGGEPGTVGSPGSWEMDANATATWLHQHGERFGWREITPAEAQAWANQGKPAVAAWHSGSPHAGHIAIVRPGQYHPTQGPAIAQAGARNLNEATALQAFGPSRTGAVKYYAHD